jgi:hypothetical protein
MLNAGTWPCHKLSRWISNTRRYFITQFATAMSRTVPRTRDLKQGSVHSSGASNSSRGFEEALLIRRIRLQLTYMSVCYIPQFH